MSRDTKKAVFFGELLMRLNTIGYERLLQSRQLDVFYTGAESNAAVSVQNFGIDSYLVSCVPDNAIGQACVNFHRNYGVNVDHIKRDGDKLGMLFVETGASQRPSMVIYDRKHSAITSVKPSDFDWEQILAGKNWFHFSGTAPALSDAVAETVKEAICTAKKLGLMVSCDLNFRRKLWDETRARAVMTDLMNYVDVLIGNEEDADKVFGIRAEGVDVNSGQLDTERYRDVARQLYEKFNFKYVAITLRQSLSASDNHWSGLLFDGQNYCFSRKYNIHLVDRVGGGDSFSGALIAALLDNMPTEKAVEFAVAASCLKQTIKGDFNLVGRSEVERLMAGDASGRVQR